MTTQKSEQDRGGSFLEPLAVIVFSAAIGLYGVGNGFADGTSINGMDVSRMTVSEVVRSMSAVADKYKFRMDFRDGTYEIAARDIDLRYNRKTGLRKMMWQQLRSDGQQLEFYEPDLFVYDENKLEAMLEACEELRPEHMTPPENASMYYDKEADKFVLEAGAPGTLLNPAAVAGRAEKCIDFLVRELDVDELGFYEEAVLTPDGPLSSEVLAEADALTDVDVEYLFHDAETERVNRKLLAPMISLNKQLEPEIDQQQLKKAIRKMTERHAVEEATIFFETTDGDEIPFTYTAEDDAVDQKKLLKDIMKCIAGKKHEERAVAYTGEAAENDNNFGGNYIEVDLSEQMLYLYKDGKMVMSTEIVSGSTRKRSRMTPTGVYRVYSMLRNVTLKGDDYESKVSYWMPFRGGYGLHDATWRSYFGGSIYQYNGSHGCVNMPLDKARELYETIDVGYRVVVYDAGMKESDDDED